MTAPDPNGTTDLHAELRGHALWLTIDRPARRNAISADVIRGLSAGLARAQADDAIRAVVITGAGDKAFCAGADLSKGSGSFVHDPSRPAHRADDAADAWDRALKFLDGV